MARKLALAVAIVALSGLVAQRPAGAWDNVNKTMYLTFSGPVRLPGVTLNAGTYVFEIANPMSTADLVVVRGRAPQKAFYLGITRAVVRPAGSRGERPVTLGEAP